MPGPARAGLVVYAKDLARMSAFYEGLLGLRLLQADASHRVLASAEVQLVLHAIPPAVAAGFEISRPPALREEQAFKPFFTVPSLSAAELRAAALGGAVHGAAWSGPGFRARDAHDPEGNVLQLREAG